MWLEDSHTTGYVGKSVVLKSGADPSWTLTRVQWSIYDNTTYIASLRNGKTHTDRFLRHKGRLELNKKSGDLTIKNLKMDDSMTYTVELLTSNTIRNENKVHLQVQGKDLIYLYLWAVGDKAFSFVALNVNLLKLMFSGAFYANILKLNMFLLLLLLN